MSSKSAFSGNSRFQPFHHEFLSRRGLRLKQASFFMSRNDDIETHNAIRFAKKPNQITGITIQSNHPESLLLIENKTKNPDPKTFTELETRIEAAKLNPEKNEPILNWYSRGQITGLGMLAPNRSVAIQLLHQEES